MTKKVSIIVPCYNHAHYLKDALGSVLCQTFTNWECIIVNDGSPDNTKIIASQWCAKDDRFVYLEKQNGGLSSARNAGIQIAKGEFILPLDADDLIHQDYLENLVPVLNQNKKLAIVSCYSNFFINNIDNVTYKLRPKGDNYKWLLYVNQLVATSLYRKSCWETVGGYDENMKKGFEDWEFWLAITKLGWNYKIKEEFLFYYRKAKQSMLVDTINNHFEANKAYIVKKHKELYIDDFDNCMTVMFHEQNATRISLAKIKKSTAYKIARTITKPIRVIKKLLKISST
ncbi:glycosyltransferase family 2 protein [Algibacter sp. L3A6]|uniref:glycosyltransferase family 2 protein n=1 Tax=Algibacter sp. L3A6 TaxID=2686366 RepID=UPI00131D83A5|nr:glycosyltransferase family A protein [Algibacter sp. L3A6]